MLKHVKLLYKQYCRLERKAKRRVLIEAAKRAKRIGWKHLCIYLNDQADKLWEREQTNHH